MPPLPLTDRTFATPPECPFSFAIRIDNTVPGENGAAEFTVMGGFGPSGSMSRSYVLAGREHVDYLNLFEAIANDFGLCPVTRYAGTETIPADVEFTPVLTASLSPEILYGYGDPAVLRACRPASAQEEYFVTVTSNDAPNAFPILRSKTLHDWEVAGFMFPEGRHPLWTAEANVPADFWAPEIHQIGDEFRSYFVAREAEAGNLCIGVARSSLPDGPFVAEARPLLRGNRIDPHVFVRSDTEAYLFWKEDSNGLWPQLLSELLLDKPAWISRLFPTPEAGRTAAFTAALAPWTAELAPLERFFVQQPLIHAASANFPQFRSSINAMAEGEQSSALQDRLHAIAARLSTPIYAQALSQDGAHLIGEPVRVLENDLPWEAHVVEGVWITEEDGLFYLFYTGNDFSTPDYAIGVAVATSPLGPFKKMANPLLCSNSSWVGPGHPSIARGPSGGPLLFFHAYRPGETGYKQFRAMLSVPITFRGSEGAAVCREVSP